MRSVPYLSSVSYPTLYCSEVRARHSSTKVRPFCPFNSPWKAHPLLHSVRAYARNHHHRQSHLEQKSKRWKVEDLFRGGKVFSLDLHSRHCHRRNRCSSNGIYATSDYAADKICRNLGSRVADMGISVRWIHRGGKLRRSLPWISWTYLVIEV